MLSSKEILIHYETAKETLSRRTLNALSIIERLNEYPMNAYFELLFNAKLLETKILKTRNAGKKTVCEIEKLVDFLRASLNSVEKEVLDYVSHLENGFCEYNIINEIESSETGNGTDFQITVQQEKILHILFYQQYKGLSVRAKNGIDRLLNRYSSFSDFIAQLLNKQIQILGIINIGRKTEDELIRFLDEFENNVNDIVSEECKPELFESLLTKQYLIDNFGLSDSLADIVTNEFPNSIEQPPIFRIIELIVCNNKRDRSIWENCICFRENQNLRILSDVAEELYLSRERVRQLRGRIWIDFQDKVLKWSKEIPELSNQYFSFFELNDKELKDSIYDLEGVSFHFNFIKKIFSLISSKKHSLLFEDDCVYFNSEKQNSIIYLINNEFFNSFKFMEFVDEIIRLSLESRTERITFDLFDLHLNYYNGEINFEIIPIVLPLCKRIITERLFIEVEGNTISFAANKSKTISGTLEEVLSLYNS